MSEEIRKVSEYSVEIVEAEKIVPEVIVATKTLEELEADYLQALNSVQAQREAFEAMIAPQQATVDLFLARLNEAKAKGVVAKPVEVVKEVLQEELNPITK